MAGQTCKKCSDGSWECGDPSMLCGSADSLFLNQTWCSDVWVKEDPHGRCDVKILAANSSNPGGAYQKFGRICYDVYTRKDHNGHCVVVIQPKDDQSVEKILPRMYALQLAEVSKLREALEKHESALEAYRRRFPDTGEGT